MKPFTNQPMSRLEQAAQFTFLAVVGLQAVSAVAGGKTPEDVGRSFQQQSQGAISPVEIPVGASLTVHDSERYASTEIPKSERRGEQYQAEPVSRTQSDSSPSSGGCLPGSYSVYQIAEQLVRAFERGDLDNLTSLLDPNLSGLSLILDSVTSERQREIKVSFRVLDQTVQCGADVASIGFLWEKRLLNLTELRPRVLRGRASMLLVRQLHESTHGWRVVSIAGQNPFVQVSRPTPSQSRPSSPPDSTLAVPAPSPAPPPSRPSPPARAPSPAAAPPSGTTNPSPAPTPAGIPTSNQNQRGNPL